MNPLLELITSICCSRSEKAASSMGRSMAMSMLLRAAAVRAKTA